MPLTEKTWVYRGKNQSGELKNGEIRASNRLSAKKELLKQGILPQQISKKRTWRRISTQDILLMYRQLTTLIRAGLPLNQSLELIASDQSNQDFSQLIKEIKQALESGLPLSDALRKHPKHFASLDIHLIRVGEHSGTLDQMLIHITAYHEKIAQFKKNIKEAMSYPLFVLLIALFVTVALLLFVVPQFAALFKGFHAQLPWMTQCVLQLSLWLRRKGLLLCLVFALASFAFFSLDKGRLAFLGHFDRYLLICPIIGHFIKKSLTSRFARLLSITLNAGLPLMDALALIITTLGNRYYQKAMEQMKQAIASGEPFHLALKNTGLFNNMTVQMVGIAEESGTLEATLLKIATLYEEETERAIRTFNRLLEPMLMSILGLLIGGLVIAMYLPIFQLGNLI